MSSAAGHALAAPRRSIDREARNEAREALRIASLALKTVRLQDEILAYDTPDNADALADRIGDVISQLVVAQSRYRAWAAAR